MRCLSPTSVLLVWLVAACSSDSATAPIPKVPAPDEIRGTLVVRVSTQGDSLDLDGYDLTLARDGAHVATLRLVGDRDTSFELRPGSYIVTLGDVAPQCELQETPTLFGGFFLSLERNGTITLDLHVACAANPGRLRITLVDGWFYSFCSGSSSEPLDVLIDDKPTRRIRPGVSMDVYPVPAGVHTVTLVAPTWWGITAESGGETVTGASATVGVPPLGLAEVKFDVFCIP